jgi:hypothetical protein
MRTQELPTFVIVPRIIVRPIDEFFIDPRQQSDRRICETVAQCLGLRRLLARVPSAFIYEPGTSLEPCLFCSSICCEHVLQVKSRRARKRRGSTVRLLDIVKRGKVMIITSEVVACQSCCAMPWHSCLRIDWRFFW